KAEPLWLIISGKNELEIYQRLDEVNAVLSRARSNQFIENYLLPLSLWPRPEFQLANRAAARVLVAEKEALRGAALSAGFSSNSFALTEGMIRTWEQSA